MARRPLPGQACSMTIKPNTTQRDLVRMAVLLNGDRPGAKYSRPSKGHSSRNTDPTLGFSR